MPYTQVKIKQEYRDKLSQLAASQNRSMANMIEVLIDTAIKLRQEQGGIVRNADYVTVTNYKIRKTDPQ